MADNRLTRELDSREVNERPKQWMPASALPEPDRQKGYAYRWIRVSSRGENDPQNVSAKFREGWEPVRVEEQPKLRMLASTDSRFKDNIEVGGLLLCKIPSDFMDQRRAHFANQTKAQIDSVDSNFMRQNDPRMPLFQERKSTSSFGKGK
jgi:hypothetical protein